MNHKFIAESALRLDMFLSEKLSLTRSQTQKIIKDQKVKINNSVVSKPGCVLKIDQEIEVEIEDRIEEIEEYKFNLDIIFEDEHLVVINKPKNLSMHPGAGNRKHTLYNALFTYLRIKPEIVHRLDKDTTGIVVVAKSLDIKNKLSEQFSNRTVNRLYKALLLTTPKIKRAIQLENPGTFTSFIARHEKNRKLFCVTEEKGKKAITNWKIIEEYNYGALVELKLETGRTHQIRVHMSYLGSPVLGDPIYGKFDALPSDIRIKLKVFNRQALHAYVLGFIHPVTNQALEFKVDLPEDFAKLNKYLRDYV